MRIISGTLRGKKLIQIQGRDIRPTADRVREALFNIIGPGIQGQRVLDLFAGTGAFGLEALSRGAAQAVFIEKSARSCEVIKKNIALTRMAEKARLIPGDIIDRPLPRDLGQVPFDLIFMDPPYAKGYAQATLGKPGFADLLAEDGMIIVEQAVKEPAVVSGNGLDIFRQKKYSKTFISFLGKSSNG